MESEGNSETRNITIRITKKEGNMATPAAAVIDVNGLQFVLIDTYRIHNACIIIKKIAKHDIKFLGWTQFIKDIEKLNNMLRG